MCDDNPSFSTTKRRRARKPHTCEECSLPIPVGDIYVYYFSIFDGHSASICSHVECYDLLLDHPDDDGRWIFGSLSESLSNSSDPAALEKWEAVKAKYAAGAST